MAGVNGKTSPFVALVACRMQTGEEHLVAALREQYSQNALLHLLRDPESETQKAAAVALSLIGDEATGPLLATALRTQDLGVHTVVEQSLWRFWFRSGDAEIDALLRSGVRLIEARRFDEACAVFDRVIKAKPGFAEGYNQRAIVRYLMGEWGPSIQDCQRVIDLNPVHFGALAGLGHCYLQQHNVHAALNAYERALAVNPHMPGIRERMEQLREWLRHEGEALA